MPPSDSYALVTAAWRIYTAIAARPHTLRELADAYGLHRDSVRRILAALERGGLEITTSRRTKDGPGQPAVEYHVAG